MAASDWIDTSGSKPSFKPLAAITGLFGTVVYGAWAGWLAFLDSSLGGVWGTIHGIRAFLANPGGVIPGLFSIAETFLVTSANQHARWLADQGLFGQVLGVIEGLVVFYALVWTLKTVWRAALGAI
jgi:hypothetical protein